MPHGLHFLEVDWSFNMNKGDTQKESLSREQIIAIYEQYGYLILRRCRYILRDQVQAQDALQEVFVKLIKYGQSFTEASHPLRWLYRVADRVCFDLIKTRRYHDNIDNQKDLAPVATATHPDAIAADREVILMFLGHFDDRTKQVAVLYYLDGLSQEQIAKETGWSRQTVNKKLKQIKRQAQEFKSPSPIEVS